MRAVVGLGFVAAISAVAAQEPVFHSAADIVPIYATIRGSDGHLITGLRAGDCELYERGKRVPVAVFSNEALPITVAIMLDTSGGLFDVPRYEALRKALLALVDRLGPYEMLMSISVQTGGFHLADATGDTFHPKHPGRFFKSIVDGLRSTYVLGVRAPVDGHHEVQVRTTRGQAHVRRAYGVR